MSDHNTSDNQAGGDEPRSPWARPESPAPESPAPGPAPAAVTPPAAPGSPPAPPSFSAPPPTAPPPAPPQTNPAPPSPAPSPAGFVPPGSTPPLAGPAGAAPPLGYGAPVQQPWPAHQQPYAPQQPYPTPQPPGTYPGAPPPQPPSRRGLWLALALVVVFFVAVVGGAALLLSGDDDTATGPDNTESTDPETTGPDSTDPETTGPDGSDPDNTGPDTTGPPTELSLADAIADINAFWDDEFEPLFGGEYEPIPDENIFPLSEAGRTIECGGQDIQTALLRGNAIYCPDDDFIAYDNEELFPRLRDEFGDLSPALVMAHEWGHAIQSRTPTPNGPTIFIELQADCFAGAWAKRLLDGEANVVAINAGDIDVAVKGYLEFSDPIGTTSRDPGAHGTGFDRINAFGEGVRAGAGGCLDYFEGGIDPVDVPIDRDFFVNEGNLDFETSLNLFPESLDEFWTEVGESEGVEVPELVNIATRRDADTFSCAVPEGELMNACGDEGAIVYADAMEELHEEIGDFATALVLGVEYAEAMSDLFGFEPTEERLECLAGAWTGRTLSGADEVLRLSAGDLDEAIVTLIELSDGSRTVFEQVGNFQEGVFEGYDACTS